MLSVLIRKANLTGGNFLSYRVGTARAVRRRAGRAFLPVFGGDIPPGCLLKNH